ncbi:hypothetical protein JMUB6875_16320 [Nocardia sp. JMUB6875]|uniref:hypothetical protein n=1 Tax=Nocardia sp. JMUB6875 TaxID=3158170 RepID=UPI0032E71D73
MRFAKTGAAAIILAAALTAAAGAAHADKTITVTAELMGCAARADIDVSALNGVDPGTEITISDALAAQLTQHGCLP